MMPLTVVLLLVGLSLLDPLLGQRAIAGPDGPHLNWGSQITPALCPTDDYDRYRDLVVNVTHHVINDADRAAFPTSPPRYWAFDDYNRHIQVWKVGVGTEGELFCALVRYQGAFRSIAGPSPQNTDPSIAAGIEGTFEGGYRVAIVGALNPAPTYRTRGNIGTFDYGWTGDPTVPPQPTFNWIATYFVPGSSVSYYYPYFSGWIYHGGANGTWVHSSSGNEGDITD